MDELSDGYAPWGELGEVLLDPQDCPAGHLFRWGIRGGPVFCDQHGDHYRWRCACGQEVYRHDGAFWGELECLS